MPFRLISPGSAVSIAAGCLLLVALVWVGALERIAYERRAAEADAFARSANLALAFEQDVIRTLHSVDHALRFVEHEYREGGRLDLRELLGEAPVDSGLFTAVSLLDARGRVLGPDRSAGPLDLSDRDYFAYHRDHPSSALRIGAPMLGRISGRNIIPVTRRIDAMDGGFEGVLVAGIAPAYFTDFFQKLDLGRGGLVQLVGTDGIVRARRNGLAVSAGGDLSDSNLLRLAAASPTGSFTSEGRLDGLSRFMSYRRLEGFPFVIAVGNSVEEAMAEFELRSRNYRLAAGGATLLLLLCAAALFGASRQRAAAVAALARSEARVRASFEQAAVGMAHLADGRILKANQKLASLLGGRVEDLVGNLMRAYSHPEDMAATEAERRRLHSGAVNEVVLEKRYLRLDGAEIWMRVSLSLVRDAAGEAPYEVAVFEDVSARRAAQEALRESEDRFRNMADHSPALVWITDAEGVCTYINERWYAFTGQAPGAALGYGWLDAVHADDRPRAKAAFLAACERRESFRLEYRLRRRDGTYAWMIDSAAPRAQQDGPFLGYIGSVIDISDRKIAESELLQKNGRLAMQQHALSGLAKGNLLNEMPLEVVVRRLMEVAASTLGTGRASFWRLDEERAGLHCVDLFESAGHRHSAGAHLAARDYPGYFRALQRDEPIAADDAHTDPRTREFSARYLREHDIGAMLDVPVFLGGRPAGVLSHEHLGGPRHWQPDEQLFGLAIAGMLALAVERAERRRADERLRESQQLFQSLVDTVDGIVWEADACTFRFSFVSRQAERLLGYPVRRWLEEPTFWKDAIHPEDREWALGYCVRATAEMKPHEFEYRMRAEDGRIVWLRDIVSVVVENGRPVKLRGLMVDVTQRKREEALLGLEHAVTRVLSQAEDATAGVLGALRVLCEAAQWHGARYFAVDESGMVLRAGETWSTADRGFDELYAASHDLSFARGEGIAGRVWEAGEPQWLHSVAEEASLPRRALIAQHGVTSGFGFPVTSEGRIVGVVTVFSREPRTADPRLLEATRVIGSQLGQFVRRKQGEAKLAVHARQQEIIAAFGQAALGESTFAELLAESVRAACGLGADAAAVFEHAADLDTWSVRAAVGLDAAAAGQRVHGPSAAGMESSVKVQIAGEAGPFGALAVFSRHSNAFSDEDVKFFEQLAIILSTALQRLQSQSRLAHLAQYDSLTGLPNRALFRDRFEQALAQARRNGWHIGVMLLDIDHFKKVNDTLGHAAGDELLKVLASRLQGCLREGDTVARLSGDEFGVLLPDLAAAEDAGAVAQSLMQSVRTPFEIAGSEVAVGATIGIAMHPADADDAATLLRHADLAMYRAKDSGRNRYRFFTAELNAEAERRFELEKALRRALAQGEFELHYQPKADVTLARITGVEALLRWRRADGRLVAPGEFIGVLEETGLIVEVGEWVLHEACRQLVDWSTTVPAGLGVAVNVSARQFRDGRIVQSVRRALAETGCAPRRLELEITESLLMHDVDVTVQALDELREMGVRVAVDDFGTGYSSLAYLKRLPVDCVKIDRSFVKDLSEDANDAAITTAIVAMAQSLGYRTVAEGVETPLQRQFLEGCGCDEVQGYLLGRPLPAGEVLSWLKAREPLPAPA